MDNRHECFLSAALPRNTCSKSDASARPIFPPILLVDAINEVESRMMVSRPVVGHVLADVDATTV
jgi:hypothetical protein